MVSKQPQHGPPDATDAWVPCPGGELRQLAVRLRARRRTRALTRAATGAVVVLLVGVAALAGLQWLGWDGVPQAMSCRECKQHLAEYREGRVDDVLRRRIEHHLNQCGSCRRAYEQMLHAGLASTATARLVVPTLTPQAVLASVGMPGTLR